MSPVFLNENKHRVAARDEQGQTVAIAAGKAKTVDGVAAEALLRYNGVRLLEGDEAVDALRVTGRPAPDPSGDSKLAQTAAEMRSLATSVTVAAPLQVVVGDDSAPHGPPSGVTSVKSVEAAKSDVAREHFAPGEALPGEQVPGVKPAHGAPADPSHAGIHNAQIANQERAEELAREAGLVGDPIDEPDGDRYDDLKGDALDDAVREAGLEGLSRATADEKRDALRAADSANE